jgi:hypothetical protein
MTVAEIITGFILVCGKFGLRLEIADGVLYVHTDHGRLGYITQGGALAGYGTELDNCHGLLCKIRKDYNLKFDFKSPGEFIAYTPVQFGIVPITPPAPRQVFLPRTPASDMQTIAYAQ